MQVIPYEMQFVNACEGFKYPFFRPLFYALRFLVREPNDDADPEKGSAVAFLQSGMLLRQYSGSRFP